LIDGFGCWLWCVESGVMTEEVGFKKKKGCFGVVLFNSLMCAA